MTSSAQREMVSFHKYRELKQEKKKIASYKHKVNELEQEKIILSEINTKLKNDLIKNHRGKFLLVCIFSAVIGFLFLNYFAYGIAFEQDDQLPLKSGYVIQNLKGDTIDTWLSWRLLEDDTLYVNIENAQKYPEQAEIIKDVILSTEFYEIDDSLTQKGPKGSTSVYHLGWTGALEKASESPTKFYIPTKFEIIDSATGAGDIIIKLVEYRNGDGYSGWAKSIADETQNQILKSEITIYEIDTLSKNQLETIVRHEFGHALGLAHSTAPEDLMSPRVTTEFPYISECDVDAVVLLYDGSKNSEIVCEK